MSASLTAGWRAMIKNAYVLVVGLFMTVPATAQVVSGPVNVGQQIQFESQLLGDTRSVFIGFPQSNDIVNGRYPVLYVLDGGAHFQYTVAMTKFLSASGRIPGIFVVAIDNTDRGRDLTTPTSVQREIDTFPTNGGAERFLRMLREELMPWVDANYRTNSYKILMGHSLGGLFTINTLITEPDAFDAYVAISPSVHWNEQDLVKRTEAFLDAATRLEKSLYLITGNEVILGLEEFMDALGKNNPIGFRWEFGGRLLAESHASVPLQGTYQALETIFADWDVTDDAYSMLRQTGVTIEDIDTTFARSGENFGIERKTPFIVVNTFVRYLIASKRLEEASELLLRDAGTYPLDPMLVSMLVEAYEEEGDQAAAVAYFQKLLNALPRNEFVARALARFVSGTESDE